MKPKRLVLALAVVASQATAKLRYNYDATADARVAEHTGDPYGLASERIDIRFQQNATVAPHWVGAFGFSAWNDFIYASRPDVYDHSLVENDSLDVRPRNVYVRFDANRFSLTAGYQQVVWGEALGTSYADLVNPRDYRDGGIGDPSDIRLQIPMVNAKLVFENVTIQGLYLPQPFFNLLPSPGNDFAFPYSTVLNGASVRITRQESLPWAASNAEYGARLSALLGSWDLSAFFLNDYDRDPSYRLDPSTILPSQIVVDEVHTRVRNYGFTLTNDFGGFLLRLEGVMTEDRRFPTIIGQTLSSAERNNPAYVIGLDLPTWHGFNSTIQWSRNFITGDPVSGLLRTPDQSLLLARVSRTLFLDHELELIESYSTTDRGSRSQLNYMIPTSKKSELRLGGEIFAGPFSSDFGKIERASRVYVLYRYHFHG